MGQLGGRIFALGLSVVPLLLTACGSFTTRDSGPSRAMDLSHVPDAIPRYEPPSRGGNPDSYEVQGRRYFVLKSSAGYVARGIASWYGRKFHGRKTSNGEVYNMYAMSAAHKTLPLPTYARVTNLNNGRSVIVRINDRGPFHENRLIDLSYAAASKLGIAERGTGLVEMRAISPGQPEPPPAQVVQAAAPGGTASGSAAAPGASTAPALPSQPTLYLQVGAFVSRTNAEQLRSRLSGSGLPAVSIQESNDRDQKVYRVRIGPVPSVEQADALASRLTGTGVFPHIVID